MKGQRHYLRADYETTTTNPADAGIWDEVEYVWAKTSGFEIEPLPEDQQMRLSGAPELPGLEA